MHNATKQVSRTPLIPGHWCVRQRRGSKPGDPEDIIKFACPLCGAEGDLSDHEVDGSGLVSPSVVCPTDDCGFHDHVTLMQFGEPEPGP